MGSSIFPQFLLVNNCSFLIPQKWFVVALTTYFYKIKKRRFVAKKYFGERLKLPPIIRSPLMHLRRSAYLLICSLHQNKSLALLKMRRLEIYGSCEPYQII